jgi:NAD(P)H-dependent FMN reductase
MNILAIPGSNSSTSINRQLLEYVSSEFLSEHVVEMVDINDYEVPLFGPDYKNEHGIPDRIKDFYNKIKGADAIVVSLAEYNGSYTTAMKNIIDWMSILEKEFWQHKPMLLLSTSPGARGGQNVLDAASMYFPRLGADIVHAMPVPSFNDNFKDGAIITESINADLQRGVDVLFS